MSISPAQPLDRLPAPGLALPARHRLAMVAMGYVPLLNVAAVAALVALPSAGAWPEWTGWLAPAWLLLVPPLVVRATLAARPLPATDVPLGSSDFLVWWWTSQWQAVFNRLPWIEEGVRLVPGAYSAWLRLWGARVGRLVYWTPGLRVLDRPLVDVGHGATFGVGVKLNPHLIRSDAAGRLVLIAATVRVGDGALVGGYSVLTAGSWVGPGEASPGKRDFRPFTGWRDGRRADGAWPFGDGRDGGKGGTNRG